MNYENINKNDYYTISKKAVTHVYNNDIEFIEIDRWEQEYLYHRELTKIPIFSLFLTALENDGEHCLSVTHEKDQSKLPCQPTNSCLVIHAW